MPAALVPTTCPPDKRERNDQGQYAAVSQLAVPEVHEVGREASVSAAEQARRFLEFLSHRLLLVVRRVEARERRNRYLGMAGFVVRGPCERGIHDDQIAGSVLDRDGVHAVAVRFCAAHGLARSEQGVRIFGIEKVERADVRTAAVDTVGHRVDSGFPVGPRGMGTGQHRAGEMRCGGHDI